MIAKKKLFIAVAALAVLVGGGIYFWTAGKGARVSYREVAVRRGDLTLTILATGTVQPANRLEIKPPIAGRVERVLVQEGQKVRRGQILAWMSSTERAALIDAARSQGADEVKKWEDLYRPTPILAPINGTIILRNVESGQTFASTDAILVMSDRLTVKAQVDETDIAQIKLKQPAEIVLDAYAGEKVAAKVDQIAFEAKTVNNVTTYLVDVLPNATPEFMRAGMTANVTFQVNSKKDVLLVPNEAVRTQGKTTVVLVRATSGRPLERDVETGISDGKQVEIVKGLEEGEMVLAAQVAAKGSRSSPGASPFMPVRAGGGGRGH